MQTNKALIFSALFVCITPNIAPGSGLYTGIFVPFKLTLRDGTVEQRQLALRNDNSNKVLVVNGGI